MHYDSWEIPKKKCPCIYALFHPPNQMGPIEWPLLVVFLLFFGSFQKWNHLNKNHQTPGDWVDKIQPSMQLIELIPYPFGTIQPSGCVKMLQQNTQNNWQWMPDVTIWGGGCPKIIQHNPFPCSPYNLTLQKKQSIANTSSWMVEMDSIVKRFRNISSNSNLPRDLNRNKPLKNRLTIVQHL